ncbi:MAG: calcium/sodium antiporter [Bacteroidetes bacterium]|nr:MAG: calcium/sodium antiporter [Bacteroidota bacterium]
MLVPYLVFLVALGILIFSARKFTQSAETLGTFFGMPSFVIGVFIVGIGTSLPELVSAILAVNQGVSEIVPGNVFGSNISNILLITGTLALLHKIDIHLSSKYIFIDLHYLLGSVFVLVLFAYDGVIEWHESVVGLIIFLVYSIYLVKDEAPELQQKNLKFPKQGSFPIKSLGLLLLAGVGIYFGADYTISSLQDIAHGLSIPNSVIALTVLSIGTTLPELVVNITAIRQGKAEMALGNVLGSCVFNSLMVPSVASFFGPITVPDNLLHFSLPVMAGAALFFYLITHDKRVSRWEGMLFIMIYVLFLVKIVVRN